TDPVVHPAELDVADDVVERLEADAGVGISVLDRRAVARHVRAGVILAVHERVDDVSVGPDRGELDAAKLILDPVRLRDSAGAALNGLTVRLLGARDAQPDAVGAVAVAAGEPCDLAVFAEPAGQDEPDVSLLEDVRSAVADAGLRSRIGGP